MIALKIITLFPEFFDGPLRAGLMGKAIESGIIALEVMDLRDFSEDRLRRCDDYPYGGGSGMVLTPGPLFRAIRAARTPPPRVILTTPAGR
ncbi:MAG TPA: tRNA (guanosine(37)-N1)-methyltransferase TrmD, partial [Spirochaetota bacterium]|nr:tRNA (guanosine(37)-N1)-methyltransferase TrmD [Spirochaetota bacterium]